MMGWGWRPYVSVATRRARAQRQMKKLEKQGMKIQPIETSGRRIVRTFWGQAWCEHLETFSDYENRLPRGRTYVRNGSVCHLDIAPGAIKAMVYGSELYNIDISIRKLQESKWTFIKEKCSGQIGTLLELLSGRLSESVMETVTDRQSGLFPLPEEISLECDCPDWADLCKHLAAVLYGVGARLDDEPELLFVLRGVNHLDLVEIDVAATSVVSDKRSNARRIDDSQLSDVFGIELFDIEASIEQNGSSSEKAVVKTKSRARKIKAASASSKKSGQKKGTTSRVKKTVSTNFEVPTGKSVRQLRERFDMSQSDFAELIGASLSSVLKWEKTTGKLNLKARTMNALLEAEKLSKKQAWTRFVRMHCR